MRSSAVVPILPRAAVPAGRGAPHAHGALLDVLVAHRAMLVNVARGFVGCASRAEDVVHDVFVKLVEFPNQDAVRQPVAYVTRMVRNASIDALRRQSFEHPSHGRGRRLRRAVAGADARGRADDARRAAPRVRRPRRSARAQPRGVRDGAAARGDAADRGAR
jgi:DNA-directed RNA polymerase specialized sigma24 family protein